MRFLSSVCSRTPAAASAAASPVTAGPGIQAGIGCVFRFSFLFVMDVDRIALSREIQTVKPSPRIAFLIFSRVSFESYDTATAPVV